ncbi:hypothetical protein V8G54_026883 [Vigna mungo]|uniref:Protein kinase domain-containing protein n=1 Tax=Vigna mungo TaxID=3915 RepID=A0AAQ3RQB7_VIGMU
MYSKDAQSSTIVLQLCQHRTLFDRIADGPLPEPHAASLTKQLLEALTHCHALGSPTETSNPKTSCSTKPTTLNSPTSAPQSGSVRVGPCASWWTPLIKWLLK